MVDSKENDKFDLGVKGLMHHIVSVISKLSNEYKIHNCKPYFLELALFKFPFVQCFDSTMNMKHTVLPYFEHDR